MLHVLDFAVAAPAKIQTIAEAAQVLGLNGRETRMYNRFFGYEEFRCDADEPLAAMLVNAERELARRNGHQHSGISILTHCHTLMSSGPLLSRNTSTPDAFHRSGIESFSLTMNHCASAVSALAVHDVLLPPDGLGIILIGDKAFHPTVRHIANTTIMGEAAVAVLVGRHGGRFAYLDGCTIHEGRFSLNSGRPDDDFLAGFDDFYIEFAVQSIKEAQRRFLVTMADIRWVLPHNANAASWRQIGQALGIGGDRILMTSMARYGHCFASDPFLNLFEAESSGHLKAKDRVLLVAIGLGATASCALIEVNADIQGRAA